MFLRNEPVPLAFLQQACMKHYKSYHEVLVSLFKGQISLSAKVGIEEKTSGYIFLESSCSRNSKEKGEVCMPRYVFIQQQ